MSSTTLKKVTVEIGGDTRALAASVANANQLLTKIGRTATTALTAGIVFAPFVTAAVKSVSAFADWDDAMQQSAAIMGDTASRTGELRGEMEALSRQLATESIFTATEAAEAFFFLGSAGLNAEEALKALPIVTQFAQAGMFDLSTATKLLADSTIAYGLAASGTTGLLTGMVNVADRLTLANTQANATVEQFAQALSNRAAASAKLFNRSLDDTMAGLVGLARTGVKGSKAGTQLSIVMRELARRALENPVAFDKLGISVLTATGEMQPFHIAIGTMAKSLGALAPATKRAALETLGFTERSMAPLLQMMEQAPAIYEAFVKQQGAAGKASKIAEERLDSFRRVLDITMKDIMEVAIEIGAHLAPAVLLAANLAKDAAQWFGNLSGKTQLVIAAALFLTPAIAAASVTMAALAISAQFVAGSFTVAIGAIKLFGKVLLITAKKAPKLGRLLIKGFSGGLILGIPLALKAIFSFIPKALPILKQGGKVLAVSFMAAFNQGTQEEVFAAEKILQEMIDNVVAKMSKPFKKVGSFKNFFGGFDAKKLQKRVDAVLKSLGKLGDSKVADEFKSELAKILESMEATNAAGQQFAEGFTAHANAAQEAAESFRGGIQSAFRDITNDIVSLEFKFTDFLQNLLQLLLSFITDPIMDEFARIFANAIISGAGRGGGGGGRVAPPDFPHGTPVGDGGPIGAFTLEPPQPTTPAATTVIVENHGNQQATTSESQNSDGSRTVKVIIGNANAEDFANNGPASRGAAAAFGLRRRPGAR